jgi:trans-aconitate methyltransferase
VSKRYEDIAGTIRSVDRLEREWMGKVPDASTPLNTPWMPFPRHDFVAMLTDAVAEAEGGRLLDVGCGPGTKMMLASAIFDLDAHGVERVPEYVAAARKMGLLVHEADAAEWKGYGEYDIVWFNRPFRDREAQRALEFRVWDELRPGAVVMCANLENQPPSSWYPILDDWEVRRGIWQKAAFKVG